MKRDGNLTLLQWEIRLRLPGICSKKINDLSGAKDLSRQLNLRLHFGHTPHVTSCLPESQLSSDPSKIMMNRFVRGLKGSPLSRQKNQVLKLIPEDAM